MKFLNLFKNKKKVENNPFEQVKMKIFPGGNAQMEREVKEVRALLDFKYSKYDIQNTYIHAASIFYISDNKNLDRILTSILHNKENVVSKSEAIKIYQYLVEKFSNQLQVTEPSSSNGTTEADTLFLIAKAGITILKNEYRDISNSGKYEVVVLNAVIIVAVLKEFNPQKITCLPDFYFKLIENANSFGINLSENELSDFILTRTELYQNEINSFLNNKYHILGKVYNCVYNEPLEPNPVSSTDLLEIMSFTNGFSKMVAWVSERTKGF